MKIKYVHEESVHNLTSPKEIVPEIIKLLNPQSVVDFGCGLGTFLHCFKNAGVNKILGIDGQWVNKNLLYKYINQAEFKEFNLENRISLNYKFDLAISLEVAEHILSNYADIFIENLTNAGNVVIFGASIPYQEGQNHINEQWPDYWEEKFKKYGYYKYDILRPLFWDNQKIFWWYKQNMMLFAPEDFKFDPEYKVNCLSRVVHPEWYLHKSEKYDAIVNGKIRRIEYFKYLLKSFQK